MLIGAVAVVIVAAVFGGAALVRGITGGAPTAQPSAASTAPQTTATPTPTTPSPAASAPPSPDPAASQPGPGDATAAALTELAGLADAEGRAPVDYDRDLFGQAWADVDRNGCDTRNDILKRDLLNPTFKPGTRDCKVLTGELLDPYDGSAVHFVSGRDTSILVQVDHVVALSWAWHHGAYAWTDEQRLAFANDPLNLLASSRETNIPKSDSGPAEWLPPHPELQCRYVERWVGVVAEYELGIDDADRSAARSVLEHCL